MSGRPVYSNRIIQHVTTNPRWYLDMSKSVTVMIHYHTTPAIVRFVAVRQSHAGYLPIIQEMTSIT